MACSGCKKARPTALAPPRIPAKPQPLLDVARGLGSSVERITRALGIPTCGGCEERKRKLDAMTPAWLRRFLI